ncbi:S-adenosyl-L-methionine-dependentmethyltransferase [Moniliophthora roreri MCA 2997]|uniref:S-adenosyl-L-methionine-dependentmethyltransferase n=2 Tax=Moniliophthora roreri TaxID=221103 RepID=V2WRZ0_MONRO|nr:S-adenosyl-L-methionine-dependentmethyltransferase [Moniliophthora roreri MCA 2997]KAI3605419.1 S-adenosyl-L-methionine-dependentmethyltransferase [Moniliophthora roreri]
MANHPQSTYIILNQGNAEAERLNKQYQFYKHFHQRNLILDPMVSVPSNGAVLDAATGTGAWILEAAQELPLSVSLHAVDLAPSLWPSSGIPPNVHHLVCSITSLPEEWTNKFDLVNQSHLTAGLKAVVWPVVISELYRITKPGGHIQLCEMAQMPPYPNVPSEVETKSASGTVWKLLTRMTDTAGLLKNPLSALPPMLEEAGFRDISIQVKPAPVWGEQLGEDSRVEALGMQKRDLYAAKDIIMFNQGFGIIGNEEEYLGLVERYLQEIQETGGLVGSELCYICARKDM